MAQADRQAVFSALLSIRSSLHMLIAKIQEPGERYDPRVAEEMRMQAALLAAILPVQNAFISSVHLTPEEKDYYGRYIVDVCDVVSGDSNFPSRVPKMKRPSRTARKSSSRRWTSLFVCWEDARAPASTILQAVWRGAA